MATLVLRTVKGTPLTNAEVDGNFSNINSEVGTVFNTANTINTNVGVLANLTTTEKSNLVAAINEIATESTSSVTITGGSIANVSLSNVSGLTTANVTENPNYLYYTNARARASISVTGAGSYDNSTGIITITGGVTSVAGATGAVSNAQIISGFTSGIAPGTSGNVLTSTGTAWISKGAGASGATLTNDISTNFDYLVGMANASTGAWTTAYVSSTKLYFNPSTGQLSSTDFNSLSDERLKENIENLENPTDIISKIEGKSFSWKSNGRKSFGVIAQQVEEILPDIVYTNVNGDKSVNYSAIIAFLIESNKQLSNRIAELEKKLNG